VLGAAGPLLALHKKLGVQTASFGGLSPLFRTEGNPLGSVLSAIRDRLVKTTPGITEAQILFQWLVAKDSVVVT
jgi:hypothetical protein